RFAALGSTHGRCRVHGLPGARRALGAQRAVAWLERGLELCAEAGLGTQESLLRQELARALRDRGDAEGAARLLRESLAQLELLGDERRIAQGRITLATLYGQMGRSSNMLETLTATAAWYRGRPEPPEPTITYLASAEAALRAGRLTQAADHLDRAERTLPGLVID
ncbi:MAG: hypothetical protein MI919_07100, partial [Holophagales bacterium]|nr:hypothetical protein [Holophagales bacterium]